MLNNILTDINEKLDRIRIPNINKANQVIEKADKTLSRTNRLLLFLEITIPILIFLVLIVLIKNLRK